MDEETKYIIKICVVIPMIVALVYYYMKVSRKSKNPVRDTCLYLSILSVLGVISFAFIL